MKKEESKRPIKASSLDDSKWTDIHNDSLMVSLGIRVPPRIPRDKNVWTKTPNEKRLLKSVRHSCKSDMHLHSIPLKTSNVKDKLIIQLVKNDLFPHTTYSIVCYQHNIRNILSKFSKQTKKGIESLVAKYYFNGVNYVA